MPHHPKALLYRASHRGTKENDILLGRFAENSVATMTESERAVFADFLECSDEDIYAWLRSHNSKDAPKKYHTLLQRMYVTIPRF